MLKQISALCLTGMLTTPAYAEFSFNSSDDMQAYVESNLLGVFYHEFGHALIDILELPIFGQEEDAADALSVYILSEFYEEETAVELAYDTAFGFLGEAEQVRPRDIPFWDNHGPNLQRYYNLVCLFYGANPGAREDVADDLGLPEERKVYCEDEFYQADHSWGAALDSILSDNGGESFALVEDDTATDGAAFTTDIVATEVAYLNENFDLPYDLDIAVMPCGEANAFYDPSETLIIMCSEFADALVQMAPDF